MSLLIPTRFRGAELVAALEAVSRTIVEGGLFVLGQNEGETEGTIFLKNDGRFVAIAEAGPGYRYREEVLRLRAMAAATRRSGTSG